MNNNSELPNNIINVGNKEPHNYIMYAITQLMNDCSKIVIFQARGHNIEKAILVSLILRDTYFKDSKIDVEIKNESTGKRIAPSISITVTRK